MGDERRINQLTAKTYANIGSSDYFAVDNASEAESKKLAALSIKTPISNLEGEVTGGSDTYSSTKKYSVGEYATHTTSGVQKLYRCKTACTAASWTTNASCFEEANLVDAVSQLNNDISMLHERARKTFSITDLSNAIAEQNFLKYDIEVGDYYVTNGRTYVIADIDTFCGKQPSGSGRPDYASDTNSVLSNHHVTILVIEPNTVTSTWWKSGVTSMATTGYNNKAGYEGSELHHYLTNTTLSHCNTDGFTAAHRYTHQKLLTNTTSGWEWVASQAISALTESQVYGAPIWSLDGYQQGEAYQQLEVFKKFSVPEIIGQQSIWLRTIYSAADACRWTSAGNAHYASGSAALGVVGLIIFH